MPNANFELNGEIITGTYPVGQATSGANNNCPFHAFALAYTQQYVWDTLEAQYGEEDRKAHYEVFLQLAGRALHLPNPVTWSLVRAEFLRPRDGNTLCDFQHALGDVFRKLSFDLQIAPAKKNLQHQLFAYFDGVADPVMSDLPFVKEKMTEIRNKPMPTIDEAFLDGLYQSLAATEAEFDHEFVTAVNTRIGLCRSSGGSPSAAEAAALLRDSRLVSLGLWWSKDGERQYINTMRETKNKIQGTALDLASLGLYMRTNVYVRGPSYTHGHSLSNIIPGAPSVLFHEQNNHWSNVPLRDPNKTALKPEPDPAPSRKPSMPTQTYTEEQRSANDCMGDIVDLLETKGSTLSEATTRRLFDNAFDAYAAMLKDPHKHTSLFGSKKQEIIQEIEQEIAKVSPKTSGSA